MAKNFKGINPLNNIGSQAAVEPVDINMSNKSQASKSENKRAAGRPKTKEPSKNINIAVPIRLIEQLQDKRGKYGLNMTQYIISLIEDDLNNN